MIGRRSFGMVSARPGRATSVEFVGAFARVQVRRRTGVPSTAMLSHSNRLSARYDSGTPNPIMIQSSAIDFGDRLQSSFAQVFGELLPALGGAVVILFAG